MYREFLRHAEQEGTLAGGRWLIINHVILYRIWTHPYLIIEHEREEERKQLMRDDDDFVVSDNMIEEEEEEVENEEDTDMDANSPININGSDKNF